jgi:hypothetical protein
VTPRRQDARRAGPAPAWVRCALVATLLAGCSPQTPGDAAMPGSVAGASVRSRSFLERMPDAPMNVTFGGTRHVLMNYTEAGVPRVLEYDENVTSDGHGQFAIVPGAVSAPAMTNEQAQFFAILQEQRDGFFYRFRDFRIRDWNTFTQNWRINDPGVEEFVAGRRTIVIEVRRRVPGAGGWYRAWIDPDTALVMRADEMDAAGALVSRVAFASFTLTPDLSAAPLHGDRSPGVAFDRDADNSALLGFQLLDPTILPAGYRFERAESLTAGSNTWARLTFGDGVEEMFFLQTMGQIGHADVDIGPRSVQVFRIGPWTVLQGQFHDTLAIVVGKSDLPSLLRMLKSAIH